MDPEETNIKARFQLFQVGTARPTMTVYEHNQLLATMSTSGGQMKIGDIITTEEGDNYKVVDIHLSTEENEVADPGVGAEMARVGTRLPYNFEIQVFLEQA